MILHDMVEQGVLEHTMGDHTCTREMQSLCMNHKNHNLTQSVNLDVYEGTIEGRHKTKLMRCDNALPLMPPCITSRFNDGFGRWVG